MEDASAEVTLVDCANYHTFFPFHNRLAALSGSAMDYLFMERAARLIFQVPERER